MRVVERFTTAAPARVVWSTLQDVADWPTWTSTVNRIEALDFPVLRMGARYRIYQPKLRPTIYVVSTLKQGEAFAWTAHMPGATMIADHRISSSGETTSVELSFEISGWVSRILEWRYRSLIAQYVATEARSLKARCEATHAH
jgi:hypothetical protein